MQINEYGQKKKNVIGVPFLSPDINAMSYTDFISFIEEENRAAGGKKTIREIVQNSFLDSNSSVLEVGATNGFTSLEIARLIKCKVCGLDLNENSINNAKERAKRSGTFVDFVQGSSYELPFPDKSFDLVVCGNALSFMEDKGQAISEIKRVIKDWGFCSIVPLWHKTIPPQDLLDRVSDAINSKIVSRKKSAWVDMMKEYGFELYCHSDHEFIDQGPQVIDAYVKLFLAKPHIDQLPQEVKDQIYLRWETTIELFNESLKYCCYSVMLFRKRTEPEEFELFESIEKRQ